MWIKSQENDMVLNTEQTQLIYVTDKGTEVRADLRDSRSVTIGEYATADESNKVLDTIFEWIVAGYKCYQMPKAGGVK